ncbi:uncharacterized protein [Aegilops tauschii subsp. strangulata]|uniref:uncharacterized protein n=1 Tax=Aegilops tauschii subsp. strangulata TaxID=200361 RepID=UPI00098A9FC5
MGFIHPRHWFLRILEPHGSEVQAGVQEKGTELEEAAVGAEPVEDEAGRRISKTPSSPMLMTMQPTPDQIRGRSGGLGIFWNDEIKLEVVGYSEYHIDVTVDELVDTKIRATFVYGEAQVNLRYKTWDMLKGIVGTTNLPWVVMSDFNEVLQAHEHDGVGSRSQGQMDAFRDALDTCGLTDLGYIGRSYRRCTILEENLGVQGMERVLDTIPQKVTPAMNDVLNALYSAQEVKTALFEMFPTKAPGPDGFPAHFFQRHWDVCGDEVTKAVLKIMEGKESPESINDTILVLIPKIASKVMSNRLKVILPEIISEEQSAFVPVLFNGKKLEGFKPSRGIRQGDPISPYLFLIAAKGLSCLLKSRSEPSSGILLSSVGAENKQYEVIYFSKGVPESIQNDIKVLLNVPNETLNEKYLGMPSDVGNSKNGCFKYLKDRLWSKVQGWIETTMSTAGKEVLVKSVAQAVPVYSMSCFKLPRGLCEHLNKLIRKFWWGSKEGKRKPHWVSWKEMTQPKGMGGLGFKDFELFNLSMLARQAWHILQNPDSMCSRLLKGVYYPNGSILSAHLGNNPSQVWRAILEGRDILRQGLVRRIGNGATTRIWEDNWLPRNEMMRPYGCLLNNPPTYVSELIDMTSATWDKQKVQATFMNMDAKVILVSTRQRREAWLENRAGSSNTTVEEAQWKRLWKTEVPRKVRMFLWRLSKQSIPTNDVRVHRHMSDSSACSICGAPDSWKHSLLECTMSRCTWALVDDELAQTLATNTEPKAKQWLFTLMSALSHESFVKLSVTLWAIWAARRKAIHEGLFQSPQTINGFINRYLQELKMLAAPTTNPNQRAVRVTTSIQRPKAPPPGHAKIHVDTSCRKGLGGAAAAVCRDETGAYLGSSALVIAGVDDLEILETIACREALALAQDLNIQNLLVASDSKGAVGAIINRSCGTNGAIVMEIQHIAVNLSCKFFF